MSRKIDLIVFDMAGTTVQDNREVEACFMETVCKTGLNCTTEEIVSMMGWSKIKVFETLWRRQMPHDSNEIILELAEESFWMFRNNMRKHYESSEILPAPGCLELFSFLRHNNIKVALTTGFDRQITDIILTRLGWNNDFDDNFSGDGMINASVSSDQVRSGRPSPYMIFTAMELCGVTDVRKVLKLGDTPSDLMEGKNAGCSYSMGITNGTHTREQLEQIENDGLVDNLYGFMEFVDKILKSPVGIFNSTIIR